ncbi:MAG: carboxypeptidase-like regulatory domain-containing protein [Bryobacteraceae bacterium]
MQKTISRLLFFCLFACAAAWAQTTAQVHGIVQDATGAAVPGADVKATQTATGATRSITTGADGGYVLTNLPVGPYRLEVTKMGFTTYIQEGITLQVNADPLIDVSLKVGAQSEQVTVEANAALVETRSQGVGQVVENQRILELPLNGRQVTDLITLSGAAVATQQTSDRFFGGLPFIAISGGAPINVDYTLDGANHINFLSGVGMPIFFPDALQEFKVETSGLAANRGNASAVAVVTKSGTNAWHGSLFEFLRNSATNANFYNITGQRSTKSSLKRNQFGGTIGGPIKQNKLFFFGGYQGTFTRADAASQTAFIPTAQMLSGDWTSIASAACNSGTARNLAAPFSGNTINPSQYAAPAVYIANKLLGSVGQTPNSCGLVSFGTPRILDEHQYGGKVDYQVSDKQTVYGRMLFSTQYTPSSLTITNNLLNASGIGIDSLAHSYAIGDTYVVSSTMVNSFRVAYNRTSSTRPGGQDYFSYCDAGVQNFWCGANPTFIGTLSVTGGFSMGTSFKEGNYNRPTSYSFNDDVNWVKGAHQMTFGVGYLHGRFNQYNNFASGGQMNFSGAVLQAGGLGLADFMLGRLNSLFQGLDNVHQVRMNTFNLYFTDAWKLNSRLTVNVGVRWEPYLPQSIMNGAAYTFDEARFAANIKSTQYVNAPAGFFYPGDQGFPGLKGQNNQWARFAPRIGLAWDPMGDGKTSIRASYAYGYAFLPGIWREDASGANPWGGRTTITRPAGGLVNPWQGIGNPFPYVVNRNATFTPRGLFLTPDPSYNQQTPTTYTWNVALQRQFGANWLASATYIGSRTMHIWGLNPINWADPTVPGATATNTDARRRLGLIRPEYGSFLGPMARYDDGATQVYHGLLLSIQKRLSRGTSVSANYTWSHCIGNFADINANGPPADETYTKPNDRNFERGNCDADRRHLFNLTALAETPRFSNNMMRMAASGWKFSGIYRYSSGSPINVSMGQTDRALTGTLRQRPNLIDPANVYTGQSGPGQTFLNAAAFGGSANLPALGTYGNLGWNALTAPGTFNFDVSLSRSFKLMEGHQLEVRAEAYNLTNSFRPVFATSTLQNGSNIASSTANAGTPTFANSTNAAFGRILGSLDPRIMQFALKYTF